MATNSIEQASGTNTRYLTQVLTSGETGTALLLWTGKATVTCIPSGTGKIQYTTSPPSAVLAGTANWIDWSRGSVTISCSDLIEGPVSAVRGVSSSGALTVEVVQ